MTGKQFKAIAIKRHSYRWQRGMAEELKCHRITVYRFASMAKIPERIAVLVMAMPTKNGVPFQ
jgi:hypothetical protein